MAFGRGLVTSKPLKPISIKLGISDQINHPTQHAKFGYNLERTLVFTVFYIIFSSCLSCILNFCISRQYQHILYNSNVGFVI